MPDLTLHAKQYKDTLQSRQTPFCDKDLRLPYERDAHRILYSDAFRRLRHKAQVFFIPNNDHICTRIEHVLHVSAAACTVARRLNLDVDLTNAIALGHDIGHAPFGHHGEKVLSDIAKLQKVNGGKFQHELHGLRVVDRLARLDREPEPGLNLTYAVRDGIVSHCGEDKSTALVPSDPTTKQLEAIADKNNLTAPATFEGCIVRLVDKMVYAGRDVEDALQAGLIELEQFQKELGNVIKVLGKTNGEIVNTLVTNLIDNGREGEIKLSDNVAAALDGLKDWNTKKIYEHKEVERYKLNIEQGMKHLFQQLLDDVQATERFKSARLPMPPGGVRAILKQFIANSKYSENDADAQIVLDFIAGMTDNYLIRSISELFLPIPIA